MQIKQNRLHVYGNKDISYKLIYHNTLLKGFATGPFLSYLNLNIILTLAKQHHKIHNAVNALNDSRLMNILNSTILK